MAIYLKYSMLLLIWAGGFLIAFSSINSGQEEKLLMLRDSLSRAQEWTSYETIQTVWAEGQQQLKIHSQAKLDPYVIWVSSAARLTETEDFRFQVFFQPDVIYIHSEGAEHWKKADYTHPVAGELQGLKEPFDLWERILLQAKTATLTNQKDHLIYEIGLHPFRDEVHGLRFDDVVEATMTAWVSKASKQLEKTSLDVKMKPSLARIFEHVVYTTEFQSVGETIPKELPKNAMKAERLK